MSRAADSVSMYGAISGDFDLQPTPNSFDGRGQVGDLLRRVRRAVRGEERVELGVVEAVHRVGADHPTWVEADHVVGVCRAGG